MRAPWLLVVTAGGALAGGGTIPFNPGLIMAGVLLGIAGLVARHLEDRT